MANYNPHGPYILGNEWVPIRNAYYASDGVTERGYQFNLATTAVPVSGAFYVSEPPGNRLAQACDVISVYPAGRETLTGPIRKLNIKPSAITVTNVGSGSIDASEGVAALLNAEDGKFIIFLADTGSFEQLQVSFDTEAHAAVLLGKRILDLRLRYSMNSPNVANASNMTFRVHNQDAFRGVIYPGATEVTNTADVGKISTLSLTELNPTWDMTANFRGQRTVLPWRFQELNRFRAGEPAATALTIFLQNNAEISTVLLGFMDLEVIFCEETRVLYGGFRTYDSNFSNFPVLVEEDYNVGAVAVRMFNPTSVPFSQGNTLPPGDYVVTVYHRDIASLSIKQGTPKIHAVRPYFNISTVKPIRVNQTTTENAQFTAAVEDVVTHITLHTATSIVTGAHAYGISAGAPVYGTLTPTQEVVNSSPTSPVTVSQVRFYARRFGETTVPLELFTVAGMYLPGISGSYASTPDNAALDVTGDIDLRADVTLEDWSPITAEVLIAKWPGSPQLSYLFYVENNGRPTLVWSNNGTAILAESATVPVPISSGRLAVRATLDVDNGAAGHTVTFYYSDTISGTWTQLGAPVVTAGVTSIFSGTGIVEVGTHTGGTTAPLSGTVHAVEIRNGIAGSVVANPFFSSQAVGTTSFVDAAGRTWTLNGQAAIIAGSNVSISVADFDALPEIVDGWREVNITLQTPLRVNAAELLQWQWRATDELAGNQWQVLTASGPTGAWGPNTAAAATGPATYGSPIGDIIELTWQSPTVTGNVSDSTSDATLFFSQDPSAVTGFAVTTTSIPVSGVSQICGGVNPRCVPTAILGNRLAWTAFGVCDDFSRTLTDTWGQSTSGVTYTLSPAGTNFYVDGTRGFMKQTSLTSTLLATLTGFSRRDVYIRGTVQNFVIPTGSGNYEASILTRFVDGSNFIQLRIFYNVSGGTITTNIRQVVGGVETAITSTVTVADVTTIMNLAFYLQVVDSTVRVKIWNALLAEPGNWTVTLTTTHLSAGETVLASFVNGTITNTLPILFAWDNLTITTPVLDGGGQLEIQRRDSLTDWQTIMLTEHPECVTSFVDVEARVGQLSEYRMRTLNALDFAGPWVTGSGTVASPGVTVNGDANSVLIFTSNEATSASLAYVMQWESEPIESFAFPEADFTTLQRLFGRDYFLAVRPEERGGERFERTILVNAAAISLPSLPNFNNLRNLMWDDLNYVCVRDELGNRWFANVLVPEGAVRGNRTLYLAKIVVTKVTDTPTPVDPGAQ